MGESIKGVKKMKGKLWQIIEKEHMEKMTGKSITDEEWELFVKRLQPAFADEVSELALEMWAEYDPLFWEFVS